MTTNEETLELIQNQIVVGEIIEKTTGQGLVWNQVSKTQYNASEIEFPPCVSPLRPAATWEFNLSKTIIGGSYRFTLDIFRNLTLVMSLDSDLAENLVDLYSTVEELNLLSSNRFNQALSFVQKLETVLNRVSGPPFVLRPNADLTTSTTWNRVPAAGTWFDKIRQPVDNHDGDATYIYDLSNSNIEFGFNPLPDWAGDSFEEVELRIVVKNHSGGATTIGLALVIVENQVESLVKSFTTNITGSYNIIGGMFWRRAFTLDDVNNIRVRIKSTTAVNYITAVELSVNIENTSGTTDEEGFSGLLASGTARTALIFAGSNLNSGVIASGTSIVSKIYEVLSIPTTIVGRVTGISAHPTKDRIYISTDITPHLYCLTKTGDLIQDITYDSPSDFSIYDVKVDENVNKLFVVAFVSGLSGTFYLNLDEDGNIIANSIEDVFVITTFITGNKMVIDKTEQMIYAFIIGGNGYSDPDDDWSGNRVSYDGTIAEAIVVPQGLTESAIYSSATGLSCGVGCFKIWGNISSSGYPICTTDSTTIGLFPTPIALKILCLVANPDTQEIYYIIEKSGTGSRKFLYKQASVGGTEIFLTELADTTDPTFMELDVNENKIYLGYNAAVYILQL